MGGWNNTYLNPNFEHPHLSHGGFGGGAQGLQYYGGHQTMRGQPQHGGGFHHQDGHGVPSPAGGALQQATAAPGSGSHAPGTGGAQHAPISSNLQEGVGQGAPISQGEPGGLSVPPGSHPPPPPQEVGAGQRGGTATNQVTEMAVDSSSTKLPLAVNSSVTPTDQQGTSIDVPESFVKGSQKSKGKPYCWRSEQRVTPFMNAL